MPDYKELYFSLFRATEQAIKALIEAQQSAEEAFLKSTDKQEDAPSENE